MNNIWPADIPFKQCDFELERSIKSFDSVFNSSSQQASYGGEFWQASISLANLTRAQAGRVMGLIAEYGRTGIMLPDAPHAEPVGVTGGEPKVTGTNQGYRLTINGCTPDVPRWLQAGDLIQVNEFFYMLTADADSDSSGAATLAIIPALRTVPTAGTPIITHGCACLMRVDAKTTLGRRISARKRYLADLDLDFVEAIG